MKPALLCLIAAASFLYYPLAYEEFETPKAFALIAFGSFMCLFVNWKTVLRDRIAQALFLFIASAAMSTVLSIDWHVSVFGNAKCPMGILVIASYLVVYLAARQIRQHEQIIDMFLACAVVVALYAIAQAFGFDFSTWNGTLKDSFYTRPMSTLGHPNFMANYLAMALPFALMRWELATGRWKAAYGAVIGIFIAAIFMSLSRGMILASGAGIITYFGMTKKKMKQAGAFFAVILALSAIVFFSVPKFKRDAETRMQAMFSFNGARLEYPRTAIKIWRKCPWFGTGTDTFELAFRNARSDYYWQIERGGSPHRAHNDFLNILATQGAFGALAAILLTIVVFINVIRANSPLAIASSASIVVFYVAGMTSFTIVATGTLFMICLSILKNEDVA